MRSVICEIGPHLAAILGPFLSAPDTGPFGRFLFNRPVVVGMPLVVGENRDSLEVLGHCPSD